MLRSPGSGVEMVDGLSIEPREEQEPLSARKHHKQILGPRFWYFIFITCVTLHKCVLMQCVIIRYEVSHHVIKIRLPLPVIASPGSPSVTIPWRRPCHCLQTTEWGEPEVPRCVGLLFQQSTSPHAKQSTTG